MGDSENLGLRLFPPTGGGVVDTSDQPKKITLTGVKDPAVAFRELGSTDEERLEYNRIRKLAVNFDYVTMCHDGWRYMPRLSSVEQERLSADFRIMIGMWLPWFSDQFTIEHAKIIASVFPTREVWFKGTCITV